MTKKELKQVIRESILEITSEGRLDGESPVDYVEYVKDIEGEPRFKMGNKDFQYVWAKYPNGKTDIGVYAFGEDRVYGYEFFRKMFNIQ